MITSDINATWKPPEFTFGKVQQGILTRRNVFALKRELSIRERLPTLDPYEGVY